MSKFMYSRDESVSRRRHEMRPSGMENYGKNETMINYQNQYGQEHVGPDR